MNLITLGPNIAGIILTYPFSFQIYFLFKFKQVCVLIVHALHYYNVKSIYVQVYHKNNSNLNLYMFMCIIKIIQTMLLTQSHGLSVFLRRAFVRNK